MTHLEAHGEQHTDQQEAIIHRHVRASVSKFMTAVVLGLKSRGVSTETLSTAAGIVSHMDDEDVLKTEAHRAELSQETLEAYDRIAVESLAGGIEQAYDYLRQHGSLTEPDQPESTELEPAA